MVLKGKNRTFKVTGPTTQAMLLIFTNVYLLWRKSNVGGDPILFFYANERI
jgi:hypothetical protein